MNHQEYSERELREQIAARGHSLFDRGLTGGSSGNISVRLDDGYLVTPTNSSLGRLDPERIARLDHCGNHVAGDQPSKETILHLSMYRSRPDDHAIVHLHSTYSVAVSCLKDINPADVLPPITAYYVMRVGRMPLVPFYPPGDEHLAAAVEQAARHARAVLLSNHGPVIAAQKLDAASDAMEELEETARLFFLLQNQSTRFLSPEQVSKLSQRYPDSNQ